MKLELAKAGNHNGITITQEDIKDMAATFAGNVPVTIGHELDDSMPAFGWVTSVETADGGNTLTGEIELGPELEQAFADGKYRNWSIGAGRNDEGRMYLHHVAFLGAVPPMIKDLKLIEMGDTSDIIVFRMNGGILLSDSEAAEYTSLRMEKREAALKNLSDAASGKLPFGKREELIRFADAALAMGGADTVEFLTELFRSVKSPVRPGLSEIVTARKAESAKSIFRKI